MRKWNWRRFTSGGSKLWSADQKWSLPDLSPVWASLCIPPGTLRTIPNTAPRGHHGQPLLGTASPGSHVPGAPCWLRRPLGAVVGIVCGILGGTQSAVSTRADFPCCKGVLLIYIDLHNGYINLVLEIYKEVGTNIAQNRQLLPIQCYCACTKTPAQKHHSGLWCLCKSDNSHL